MDLDSSPLAESGEGLVPPPTDLPPAGGMAALVQRSRREETRPRTLTALGGLVRVAVEIALDVADLVADSVAQAIGARPDDEPPVRPALPPTSP